MCPVPASALFCHEILTLCPAALQLGLPRSPAFQLAPLGQVPHSLSMGLVQLKKGFVQRGIKVYSALCVCVCVCVCI